MFWKKEAKVKQVDPKEVAAPTNKTKTPSTQEWLPITDIKNSLVYKRDNSIVAAIRIQPVNINLLSDKEKMRRVKRLEEVLNGIDYSFQVMSIGKPVDLDSYINKLEDKRSATESIIKKNLLGIYSRQAVAKATSGEALERHFYLLIDLPLGKRPQLDEQILLQRATQLASSLTSAELISSVCTDSELRTLHFIFTNPAQAAFERAPTDISVIPPLLFAEEVYE